MKKALLLLVLVFAVSLLGLSTFVSAQEEVTLSAWTHDQLYIDYFNSRIDEWEAMHPDITFTYDFQIIPEVWDRVLEGLAAGEEVPDLLGLEQGGFPNYMKDGVIANYFVDLTDLIGDRRDEYAEGRWSIYSYQGRIYAVESSLTASVYYYQPAVFEEYGVEVPATWEEMLELGETVFGPEGISLNVATNSGNWFQMLFNERGGDVFDESGEFVFGDETNRPLAIEVSDYIQRAVANGTFFVVLGDDHWSGVTIPTAYREGRLIGHMMPDWWSSCCLKPNVEDMTGQWRIAPPPTWEGGGYSTTVWGGTGWAVAQGEDQEIAWEFLDFMYLGKESQVQRFEQINMFPTNFEAMQDPRVSGLTDDFYGGQDIGSVYASIGNGVPVWYQSPFRSNWSTAVGDNLPLLFDGSMTPEAFVDQIISITQDAIDFGF
ncbi:MAG: extracellular solute-binding protein [Anaerolineae bacterium]|nr:extracellular solute-binding protein [Anaerolineae bacterium]MCA9887567.1 extracellular solute-binding protein [Anaerolineae bacterium]